MRARLNGDELESVLARLVGSGIVNDQRLAERLTAKWVEDVYAPNVVRQRLLDRGAEEAYAEAALATIDEATWRLALDTEISAKIKKGDSVAKLGRFLTSRGFEESEIESALARHFD